jgi:hypothetical protein
MSSRRRSLLRATVLALLAMGAAATARAQSTAQPTSAEGTLPARLQPAARQALEALADSLRRQGLPASLVYSKAAEGVFKGADDARIVTAARALVHGALDAQRALGARTGASAVVAAASALAAGVSVEQLRAIRDATRDPEALAVAYLVVGDLVSRRVPSDRAAASGSDLLARREPAQALQPVREREAADIAFGTAPTSALANRTREVMRPPVVPPPPMQRPELP